MAICERCGNSNNYGFDDRACINNTCTPIMDNDSLGKPNIKYILNKYIPRLEQTIQNQKELIELYENRLYLIAHNGYEDDDMKVDIIPEQEAQEVIEQAKQIKDKLNKGE